MGNETFEGEIVMPIPADMHPRLQHPHLNAPAAHWAYRNTQGAIVSYIVRFNQPNGDKDYLPRTLWRRSNGEFAWRWKNTPAPRPLYGLELLAARPDASVIVTEGEKACDSARIIFSDYVVVSPMNGAKAPHKADWAPLEGRDVVIWPDNDSVGADFANAVARIIRNIAHNISIIDAAELVKIDGGNRGITRDPDGWDAADAVDEWPDRAALSVKVLELAKPYELKPKPDGRPVGISHEDVEKIAQGDMIAIGALATRLKANRLLPIQPDFIAFFASLPKDAWRTLRQAMINTGITIHDIDQKVRWGDDERAIITELAHGDTAAFLARAKDNVGFPFEPDAIAALNKLAKGRSADWMRLRVQLKDVKIPVSKLDEAMKRAAGANGDIGDGLPGRPVKFKEIEPWD
jgi:hypothetical protein